MKVIWFQVCVVMSLWDVDLVEVMENIRIHVCVVMSLCNVDLAKVMKVVRIQVCVVISLCVIDLVIGHESHMDSSLCGYVTL